MCIGSLRARLQSLLHLRQLSRPGEIDLLEVRPASPIDSLAVGLRVSINHLLFPRRFGIHTAPGPVVRQRLGPPDGSALHVLPHRHIEIIQLNTIMPVLVEIIDNLHGMSSRGADNLIRLRILTSEGDGDSALTAGRCLEGAADRSRRQIVHG